MVPCRCPEGKVPLCWACVEDAVKQGAKEAERIAKRWGTKLRRERPGLPWPGWDDVDERAQRMRIRARQLGADLHADPAVHERLARYIGVGAGRAYCAEQRRPEPIFVPPPPTEPPTELRPFGAWRCPACTFTISGRIPWERIADTPPQWRTVSPCCDVEIVTEPDDLVVRVAVRTVSGLR